MKYEVVLRSSARKALGKFNNKEKDMVVTALNLLADDPRGGNARKLSDTIFFRVRIRDIRIIYKIDDENKRIYVNRIARRRENTYRDL